MGGVAKTVRKYGTDPLTKVVGRKVGGSFGRAVDKVDNKVADWFDDINPSRLVPKPPKVKMPDINIPEEPEAPPPMPLPDDEAVEAAQRKSMATQRRRSGRRSTIYTAASGGLLGE